MDWTWLYVIAGAALNNLILLVWKPWTQAYAGEKGKNFARKEDLDKILAEVRAVTIVQKEIEAKVSGAVWDRQTQWNQKRDIYAGLLAAFSELELAFEKMTMIDLVTPGDQGPKYTEAERDAFTSIKDLQKALGLARVFLSPKAVSAVEVFTKTVVLGLDRRQRLSAGRKNLQTARDMLIEVGAEDLDLNR